jgi:hypothetical protein
MGLFNKKIPAFGPGQLPTGEFPIPAEVGAKVRKASGQEPEDALYSEILTNKTTTDASAYLFWQDCRRADLLYFPTDISEGGADHWADHPTARTKGKVHVSVNDADMYVDIPADIQSIPPDVEYLPVSPAMSDIADADRREKLMRLWWLRNNMDLSLGAVARVRALYGVGVVQPYWENGEPKVRVEQTPQNLRIGWAANDYTQMDWAMRIYALSPAQIERKFKLLFDVTQVNGEWWPLVYPSGIMLYESGDSLTRRTMYERAHIVCFDYWYRDSAGKVWNAGYVGNHQLHLESHSEFDEIPFIWIPNGIIPGRPQGAGELYRIEPLIRERDEALTRNGQAFASAGQMFQVVGPNAPSDRVQDSAFPKPGKVSTPGPGNELKPVQPWMPEYQLDLYLKRLDTLLMDETGISETLKGVVQQRVLGSSKALRTEVMMYEPRIQMKRDILYSGMIHRLWEMTAKMWERKDPRAKKIIAGQYQVMVTAPEIIAHDDLEQMQRASVGVQNRIISLRTAHKWIGILNSTEEIAEIVEQQTNAALNPQAVTQQISLIATTRQLGMPPEAVNQTQQPTAKDLAMAQINGARLAALANPQAAPGGAMEANQQQAPAPGGPANAMGPNGAPAAPSAAVPPQQGGAPLPQQQPGQPLPGGPPAPEPQGAPLAEQGGGLQSQFSMFGTGKVSQRLRNTATIPFGAAAPQAPAPQGPVAVPEQAPQQPPLPTPPPKKKRP